MGVSRGVYLDLATKEEQTVLRFNVTCVAVYFLIYTRLYFQENRAFELVFSLPFLLSNLCGHVNIRQDLWCDGKYPEMLSI
jgi:hypothetical protein